MADKDLQFLQDGKIKELILKEEKIKKFWERNWSEFASHSFYEKIIREECVKAGKDPDFIFKRAKRKNEEKQEPSIFDIKPSQKPLPTLSSQVIGWRSGPEYSLEIAGQLYISPRKTMYPPGLEEPEYYQTIFLG